MVFFLYARRVNRKKPQLKITLNKKWNSNWEQTKNVSQTEISINKPENHTISAFRTEGLDRDAVIYMNNM